MTRMPPPRLFGGQTKVILSLPPSPPLLIWLPTHQTEMRQLRVRGNAPLRPASGVGQDHLFIADFRQSMVAAAAIGSRLPGNEIDQRIVFGRTPVKNVLERSPR